MTMKRCFLAAAACCALAAALAGCASIDEPRKERRAQTDAYTNTLERARAALPARPLTIDDCVRLAVTNGCDARKADLERELARFKRDMAFSTFLPKVTLLAGYESLDREPVTDALSQDWTVYRGGLAMPIFMPSTWFLFGAARDGYISAGIVANYTRQALTVQTSIAYYKMLVEEDVVRAIRSQLAAAEALTNRVEGLAEEGFARPWERGQARLLVAKRQAELDMALRRVEVLRGELLQKMGLSPVARVEFSRNLPPVEVPPGPLAARVVTALETHPELMLADRVIVARENKVRQAFCAFLPTLSMFGTEGVSGSNLLDFMGMASIESMDAVGMGGFVAAWNIFNGFANLSQFRGARAEKRKSEVEREATFLAVILRVVTADAALADAGDKARVATAAFEVARDKCRDYEAKAKEGLIPESDALDARASQDEAEIRMIQAQYLERIQTAGLTLAMGITKVPGLEPEEGPASAGTDEQTDFPTLLKETK